MLYNINPRESVHRARNAALRVGAMKLILGNPAMDENHFNKVPLERRAHGQRPAKVNGMKQLCERNKTRKLNTAAAH